MTARELCDRLNAAYRGDCFEVVNDHTVRYHETFDCHEDGEPHDVAWEIMCVAWDIIKGVIPAGWGRGESWSDNDSLGFDLTSRNGAIMTDETRAKLRRFLELALRTGDSLEINERPGGVGNYYELTVFGATAFDPPLPPITTAQQLALSVLVGDESVLPQALADYLMDQGHEYARECYEKGKREERERCAKVYESIAKRLDY